MSTVKQEYVKDENNEVFSPITSSGSVYFNGSNTLDEEITNLKRNGTYIKTYLVSNNKIEIPISDLGYNPSMLRYRMNIRSGSAIGILMFYCSSEDYSNFRRISLEGGLNSNAVMHSASRGEMSSARVGITQPLTSNYACDTAVIDGTITNVGQIIRNVHSSYCITDSASRDSFGMTVYLLPNGYSFDRILVKAENNVNIEGNILLWGMKN